MTIDGIPGKFYAQAFIGDGQGRRILCGCYHDTATDARFAHANILSWPIEMNDGIAYLPALEEMGEFRDA